MDIKITFGDHTAVVPSSLCRGRVDAAVLKDIFLLGLSHYERELELEEAQERRGGVFRRSSLRSPRRRKDPFANSRSERRLLDKLKAGELVDSLVK